MPIAQNKTARFASLVQAGGTPRNVSLWTDPASDKAFMRAVKQDRVLSLRQDTGTKTDSGQVGFVPEPRTSYLVFPRSVGKFKGRRVIGIKYELIQAAAPLGALVKPTATALPPGSRRERAHRADIGPREPALRNSASKGQSRSARLRAPKTETAATTPKRKQFRVTVRFRAETDVVRMIEGDSKAEVREASRQQVPAPDFSRATITRRILRIEPLD